MLARVKARIDGKEYDYTKSFLQTVVAFDIEYF